MRQRVSAIYCELDAALPVDGLAADDPCLARVCLLATARDGRGSSLRFVVPSPAAPLLAAEPVETAMTIADAGSAGGAVSSAGSSALRRLFADAVRGVVDREPFVARGRSDECDASRVRLSVNEGVCKRALELVRE